MTEPEEGTRPEGGRQAEREILRAREDHRELVMADVRAALAGRDPVAHPGGFGSWGLSPGRDAGRPAVLSSFIEMWQRTGGSVVRLTTLEEATAWMEGFSADYSAAAVGETVPGALRPALPVAPSEDAPLGVSWASAGVAETGSVLLDARDGRRVQLLPPVHLVWLRESSVHATQVEAFADLGSDLPSAVGIHSGPSKSADIGQILVTGVHGPGTVVVGLLGFERF